MLSCASCGESHARLARNTLLGQSNDPPRLSQNDEREQLSTDALERRGRARGKEARGEGASSLCDAIYCPPLFAKGQAYMKKDKAPRDRDACEPFHQQEK